MTAVLGEGLLVSRGGQPGRAWLRFGCSPQDAWLVLGAPEGRADANDAMLIHAASRGPASAPGDYFLNYFSLGIDVLFCAEARSHIPPPAGRNPHTFSRCSRVNRGSMRASKQPRPPPPQTHTAKKFVLHTNTPGHAEFGVYAKCGFALTVRPSAGAVWGTWDV